MQYQTEGPGSQVRQERTIPSLSASLACLNPESRACGPETLSTRLQGQQPALGRDPRRIASGSSHIPQQPHSHTPHPPYVA